MVASPHQDDTPLVRANLPSSSHTASLAPSHQKALIMIYPTVTEIPRDLEPANSDTFTQDLNGPKAPGGELASQQPGHQPGGRRAANGVGPHERPHAPQHQARH